MAFDLHAPGRVRVVGRVLSVHADGRFTLALDDGREATGRAADARLMRLARHLGQRMVVLGTGEETSIAADGVLPAEGPFRLGSKDMPTTESENAEMSARQGRWTAGWPAAPVEESDEKLDTLARDDR